MFLKSTNVMWQSNRSKGHNNTPPNKNSPIESIQRFLKTNRISKGLRKPCTKYCHGLIISKIWSGSSSTGSGSKWPRLADVRRTILTFGRRIECGASLWSFLRSDWLSFGGKSRSRWLLLCRSHGLHYSNMKFLMSFTNLLGPSDFFRYHGR